MTERLPRLPQNVGLFLPSGKPTQTMQRWWERVCEEIETSRSTMDDIPAQTVAADHTGAALTGELPRTVLAKRYFNGTDVTTSSTWSITTRSGSITNSIGAATGVITLDSGALAVETILRVTSVRQGITLYKDFIVSRVDNAPPASGSGGGSSSSDSTFASINSATHAAITDELTVTTGTVGTVTLSAPLSVRTAAASPDGTFEVLGKWQWWDGAAWVDLAAEVASNPDVIVGQDAETGAYIVSQRGTLDVPDSKTGLTATTAYQFRLMARNSSGTRTMTFVGTASGVGS